MDIEQIDLDMLREVANVGAGNAATALSIMAGQQVDISVPNCEVISYKEIPERLGGAETVVLGMLVKMQGDLEGYMLFTQTLEQARLAMHELAGVDVAATDTSVESFEPMREVANILLGTYLSSVAEMAHLSIVPSVPEITIDMSLAIMNIPVLVYGETSNDILLLDAQFGGTMRSISGVFFMVPTPESLRKLRGALLGSV